jgi:hypothetical protein
MLLLAALACIVLTNAYVAKADFTFGEPVNLKLVIPVLDAAIDDIDCFSYDGLEMYISSQRSGGHGDWDLWVLRRASTHDNWGPPENLGPVVNTTKNDANASVSADGLTLYIESDRPGGYGNYDIYMTTRATRDASWGQPLNLGPEINKPVVGDACPWISANDLELYFTSFRADGYGRGDIYVTIRATANDPWGKPVNLGPVVNSARTEVFPCLSRDGLRLLFSDGLDEPPRPGGYGGADMWMTRRASLSDAWQPPVNLGPRVNRSIQELAPRISPDGSTLYFLTNSAGIWENWQASILPVVDFNGDGIVDCVDICMLVDHLDTNEPLYDIAPVPLGDGVVDAQDLIVLTEHLTKKEVDPNAVTP